MKIQCPKCEFSREVHEEKIPARASLATCPKCGHKFHFREPEPEFEVEGERRGEAESVSGPGPEAGGEQEEQNTAEEQDIWASLESLDPVDTNQGVSSFEQPAGGFQQSGSPVPWEDLKTYGLLQGFAETVKKVMLSPMIFFKSMPLDQNFTQPLVFYLLVAEIQVLARFFWGLAGVAPQMENSNALPGFGLFGGGSVLLLFLYPVLMTLMLFFASGLNHLCLTAVKSGRAGFMGTFKVVAYANAPMVLAIVPVFGPLAGMIWAVVCTFLGFKLVHQTTGGRVIAAMLLPVLIILLLSSFMLVARGVSGG